MEEEKKKFNFKTSVKSFGSNLADKFKWFTNIDNIIFVLMILAGVLIPFATDSNIESINYIVKSSINGINVDYAAPLLFVITLASIIQVYLAFSFKAKRSLGSFIAVSIVTIIVLIAYVYLTLIITTDTVFAMNGSQKNNPSAESKGIGKIITFAVMTIGAIGMLVGNILAAFRINFKFDKRTFD